MVIFYSSYNERIILLVVLLYVVLLYVVPTECTDHTLSLQKKAIRLNNQGKTMIAKDSFVPLL